MPYPRDFLVTISCADATPMVRACECLTYPLYYYSTSAGTCTTVFLVAVKSHKKQRDL